MSGDRRHLLEALLQTAARPEAVSYGVRVRVLQAASRANVQRQRRKQFLALAVTAMLFLTGLIGGTAAVVRRAGPGVFFARWEESAVPTVIAPATGRTAAAPDEWRLVDSIFALRESRGRILRAGM